MTLALRFEPTQRACGKRGYLERVFPKPADKNDERAMARVQRARAASGRLFEEGLGNRAAGVRGDALSEAAV